MVDEVEMEAADHLNFEAPATLLNWPSLKGERLPLESGVGLTPCSEAPWTSAFGN